MVNTTYLSDRYRKPNQNEMRVPLLIMFKNLKKSHEKIEEEFNCVVLIDTIVVPFCVGDHCRTNSTNGVSFLTLIQIPKTD